MKKVKLLVLILIVVIFFYNLKFKVYANITNLTPLYIFTGEAVGDGFGRSVGNVGDINGDGINELGIAGYNKPLLGGSNRGRVYIYLGGNSFDTNKDITLDGTNNYDYFGAFLNNANVNGDNFDDLFVGKPEGTGNYSFIFFGSSSGIPSGTKNDANITFNTGSVIKPIGNFNVDLYDDWAISDRLYNSLTGRVYVYFGGESIDNNADITLNGEGANHFFGQSITFGDINGDGYNDLVVTASGANSNGGKIYVYYGGQNFDDIADITINGTPSSPCGFAMATVDINGDGYDDIIAGDTTYDSYKGRAIIYYGSTDMDSTADVIITGTLTAGFGGAIDYAGELNNDGYDDVIISAYNNVGILFGRRDLTNINAEDLDIFLTGDNPSGSFGGGNNTAIGISNAGDVNNDGWKDFVVGDFTYSSNTGRAYLYSLNYGNSLISINEDYILTSNPFYTGNASNVGFGIGKVQWSNSNELPGNWYDCNANDGAFDSESEYFTCYISGLPDGETTIYFRTTDVNNVFMLPNDYLSDTFTIDTTPPEISQVSVNGNLVDEETVLDSPRPIFSGTSEAGAVITIEIGDGVQTGTVIADEEGNWLWIPDNDIPAGSYKVTITSMDSAGNERSISFNLTIALAKTGIELFLYLLTAILLLTVPAIKKFRIKV